MSADSHSFRQTVFKCEGPELQVEPVPVMCRFFRFRLFAARDLSAIEHVVKALERLLRRARVGDNDQMRICTLAVETVSNALDHAALDTSVAVNVALVRAAETLYVSLFTENIARQPVRPFLSVRRLQQYEDRTEQARGHGLGICYALADGMMATVVDRRRTEFAVATTCHLPIGAQ